MSGLHKFFSGKTVTSTTKAMRAEQKEEDDTNSPGKDKRRGRSV